MSEAVTQETATEEDLGWALTVLFQSYRDAITPALGDFPHGARGYLTMREVLKDQQPSQLTLANRLGIDRTVMTYLIDDLVDAGFAERRPNPADRRQRLIVATPRGRDVIAALCTKVTAAEEAMLASLGLTEQLDFRRLSTKAACGIGAPETGSAGVESYAPFTAEQPAG